MAGVAVAKVTYDLKVNDNLNGGVGSFSESNSTKKRLLHGLSARNLTSMKVLLWTSLMKAQALATGKLMVYLQALA